MSIDWHKVRDLGDVPDRVIAERLGCARSTVASARRRLGITRRAPMPDSALGTAPDATLAARYGLAESTVARRRREAGVEPYADPTALVLDAESLLAALADKKRRRAIGPRNMGELADACGWPRASMAHYTRREQRVAIPPDRAQAIVDALLAGEGVVDAARLAALLGLEW